MGSPFLNCPAPREAEEPNRNCGSCGILFVGRVCSSPSPEESPGLHSGAIKVSSIYFARTAPCWMSKLITGVQDAVVSVAASPAPLLPLPFPHPEKLLHWPSVTPQSVIQQPLHGVEALSCRHRPSTGAFSYDTNTLYSTFMTPDPAVRAYHWLQAWGFRTGPSVIPDYV